MSLEGSELVEAVTKVVERSEEAALRLPSLEQEHRGSQRELVSTRTRVRELRDWLSGRAERDDGTGHLQLADESIQERYRRLDLELNASPIFGSINAESASLTNAKVMACIFSSLDTKTVQSCRLVCKQWDKFARTAIMKTNEGYGPVISLPKRNYYPDTEDLHGMSTNKEAAKSVVFSPAGYFSNVVLTSDDDQEEVFKILQISGRRVRKLHIVPPVNMTVLHEILGWCPNLQSLEFQEVKTGLSPIQLQAWHPEWPVLQLENLSFAPTVVPRDELVRDEWNSGLYRSPTEDLEVAFFASLIAAAPKLKSLTLKDEARNYSALIFGELVTSKISFKGLQQLSVCVSSRYQGESALGQLCQLEFGEDFHRLEVVGNVRNVNMRFLPEDLNRFLAIVKGSLRTLRIACGQEFDTQSETEVGNYLELPRMDDLSELDLACLGRLKLRNFDFLDHFWKLRVLRLSFQPFADITEGSMPNLNLAVLLNNSTIFYAHCTHEELRELYFYGSIVGHDDLLQLRTALPNLTKLLINVSPKVTERKGKVPAFVLSTFEKSVREIAKWKHLTHLYLALDMTPLYEKDRVVRPSDRGDVIKAFGVFEELDNVTEFGLKTYSICLNPDLPCVSDTRATSLHGAVDPNICQSCQNALLPCLNEIFFKMQNLTTVILASKARQGPKASRERLLQMIKLVELDKDDTDTPFFCK